MKMKAKRLEEKGSGKGVFLSIVKGSVYALCISLVCILLFAFLLKFTSLSDNLITPINQVIKGVSILLVCCLGLKNKKKWAL